jgi:hypothetical protein
VKAIGVWAVAAAVALGAGCGDDGDGEAPADGPLVEYARSGGVASTPERLTISNDGAATLVSGIEEQRSEFTLDEAELADLRAELEAANFDTVGKPGEPNPCADCFIYEVVYGGRTISYDDIDTPPESVTAVVAHLGEIAAAHHPPER